MRLYKFRNINASSIRTIMIASCLDDPRRVDSAMGESRKRKGSESEETTLSGADTSHTECKQGKARRRGNKGRGCQKMQLYSDEQNNIHLLEVDHDSSDVTHTIEYNNDYRLAESTTHELAQSQDDKPAGTEAGKPGFKVSTRDSPSPPRPATLPARFIPLRTHDMTMYRDASTSTEPDLPLVSDKPNMVDSQPENDNCPSSSHPDLGGQSQGQGYPSDYLDLDDNPEDSDFESDEEEDEISKYVYLQRRLKGEEYVDRLGSPVLRSTSPICGLQSSSLASTPGGAFASTPTGDKYLIFTTGRCCF